AIDHAWMSVPTFDRPSVCSDRFSPSWAGPSWNCGQSVLEDTGDADPADLDPATIANAAANAMVRRIPRMPPSSRPTVRSAASYRGEAPFRPRAGRRLDGWDERWLPRWTRPVFTASRGTTRLTCRHPRRKRP